MIVNAYVSEAHSCNRLEGPIDRDEVLVERGFVPEAHLVDPTVILTIEHGDIVPDAGEDMDEVKYGEEDLCETCACWIHLQELDYVGYKS